MTPHDFPRVTLGLSCVGSTPVAPPTSGASGTSSSGLFGDEVAGEKYVFWPLG